MWSRTFHWSAVLFTLGMVHVRYQMGCLRCAYAHSTIYALWIAMVERKTYRRPDMARLVHGCPLSSFSCSRSPCFVCWCLSVFVNSCGGCCSRCCSCCTLLVCLARAMASHKSVLGFLRSRDFKSLK